MLLLFAILILNVKQNTMQLTAYIILFSCTFELLM